MRGVENAQKALFYSDNYFDFPPVLPYTEQVNHCLPIDFRSAVSSRSAAFTSVKCNSLLHFFIDDFKFQSIWNFPERYINLLQSFKYVVMPDFSLYYDFPVALQIYNKYRNHWLASYYAMNDVFMIPNINIGAPEVWDWSFLGFPKNSVIAISDIGRIRNKSCRELKLSIIQEIFDRLSPSQVLYFTRSRLDSDLDDFLKDAIIFNIPFLK